MHELVTTAGLAQQTGVVSTVTAGGTGCRARGLYLRGQGGCTLAAADSADENWGCPSRSNQAMQQVASEVFPPRGTGCPKSTAEPDCFKGGTGCSRYKRPGAARGSPQLHTSVPRGDLLGRPRAEDVKRRPQRHKRPGAARGSAHSGAQARPVGTARAEKPVSHSPARTCTPAGPSTEQPAARDATQCHTYPDLVRARRCRLVVTGVEIGGRLGAEAATWLRLLARHHASAAPAAMACSVVGLGRQVRLAQSAFAAPLLELTLAGDCTVGGETPAAPRPCQPAGAPLAPPCARKHWDRYKLVAKRRAQEKKEKQGKTKKKTSKTACMRMWPQTPLNVARTSSFPQTALRRKKTCRALLLWYRNWNPQLRDDLIRSCSFR